MWTLWPLPGRPRRVRAELANMINEAALLAVKQNRRIVRQEDLMEAVETVIAGYQRKTKVLSQREKRIVAYHEIGHALVARQSDSAPVTRSPLSPAPAALATPCRCRKRKRTCSAAREAFNKIATLYRRPGGRGAVFGSYTSGASNDIEQATRLARSMVTRLGMSAEFDMMALETVAARTFRATRRLPAARGTAEKIDREVLAIIRSAYEKAAGILAENKEKLHELANFLMERETITGEEFMEILHRE